MMALSQLLLFCIPGDDLINQVYNKTMKHNNDMPQETNSNIYFSYHRVSRSVEHYMQLTGMNCHLYLKMKYVCSCYVVKNQAKLLQGSST